MAVRRTTGASCGSRFVRILALPVQFTYWCEMASKICASACKIPDGATGGCSEGVAGERHRHVSPRLTRARKARPHAVREGTSLNWNGYVKRRARDGLPLERWPIKAHIRVSMRTCLRTASRRHRCHRTLRPACNIPCSSSPPSPCSNRRLVAQRTAGYTPSSTIRCSSKCQSHRLSQRHTASSTQASSQVSISKCNTQQS